MTDAHEVVDNPRTRPAARGAIGPHRSARISHRRRRRHPAGVRRADAQPRGRDLRRREGARPVRGLRDAADRRRCARRLRARGQGRSGGERCARQRPARHADRSRRQDRQARGGDVLHRAPAVAVRERPLHQRRRHAPRGDRLDQQSLRARARQATRRSRPSGRTRAAATKSGPTGCCRSRPASRSRTSSA